MNMTPQTALHHAKTVMLDMDGTLLDLAYDNFMWLEHIPRRYAAENGLDLEEAISDLMTRYRSVQGSLEWYCLDHWCDRLGFDVVQMHHDMSHRIRYLPGARKFLQQLQQRDVQVLLVTNSHPGTLELKDAVTGLCDFFDGIHSSHDIGHAKESQAFWKGLHEIVDFDPATTLFVDDTESVLQNAREFGVELLVTVTRPDTRKPARSENGFSGVEGVVDLL